MSERSLLSQRKLVAIFTVFGIELLLNGSFARAAEPKPAQQLAWEKVMAAARAEDQVIVYGDSQGTHADIIGEFNRDYPDIKVVTMSGRNSQLAPRLVAERKTGKYLADVLAGGSTDGYRTLKKEAFDPIPPALILPDVVDKSKQYKSKHYYPDPKNQYIFIYEGNAETGYLRINTKTFKKDEFKSYWDVLDKKWAGKILIFDPLISSIQNIAILYADPRVDPEFVKRLFADMNISISKERHQATDWLAQGVFPICFFCRDIEIATKQGLPIDNAHMKEAVSTIAPGGNAALHLMSKAPHPNATKVFIN